MPDTLPVDDGPAEATHQAMRSHLAEALDTLARRGVPVIITGEPARYEVEGVLLTEGQIVARVMEGKRG